MRAVVWHGRRDVRVDSVPDPSIQLATDAIIRLTSSGLCGSDLHLYEVLSPFMTSGDILGHEPMGVVEAVGSAVTNVKVGDRVVVPFGIACGQCLACEGGLQSQCEATRDREQDTGAALFGYTKLYGQVPGAQAEYLRVPMANYGPIPVPEGLPDDRYVYLSDVLPTAWQAVNYADIPHGGSLAVLGLGPIGDMSCRVALHQGASLVIGIDQVDERLARARARGVTVLDRREFDDPADLTAAVLQLTKGLGPNCVIDAVGMEADGSRTETILQASANLIPDRLAEKLMTHIGMDRLSSLKLAIALVRRGGTISIAGVYGGMTDPLPMMTMFDKQVTLRMGQANVRRWIPELMPLVLDGDPLGLDDFATHHLPLEEAPTAYKMFQEKANGAVKILFNP